MDPSKKEASNKQANQLNESVGDLFGWSKSISAGLLSSETVSSGRSSAKWCHNLPNSSTCSREIVDMNKEDLAGSSSMMPFPKLRINISSKRLQATPSNTQVLQKVPASITNYYNVCTPFWCSEHGHDFSFKNTPTLLRTPGPKVPDCCDLQLKGTPQQWKSWIMTVPMRGSYCWWKWLLRVYPMIFYAALYRVLYPRNKLTLQWKIIIF